jgi:hypothetical protein
MLHMYVSSVSSVSDICSFVSYGYYKSRSGDVAHVAIVSEACCKRMFRVFQMFEMYVSSMFSGRMLKCVYLDAIYVSHIRCMYFIWMLRIVAMIFKYVSGIFLMFPKHVFDCFNCCIWMIQK